MNSEIAAQDIDWGKVGGLVPAVVQHWRNGEVLMLGYMNLEALQHSLASGRVTFYSRSKQRLWTKGESSGNVLRVSEMRIDCDQDAVWIIADPAGPACHTNARSCFYRTITPDGLERRDD